MEIWKSIQGYEGFYEVSNKGRIKSLKRTVKNSGSYSGKRIYHEKILKQNINRLGYHVVTLSKHSKRKFFIVHRIVANAFIDNPKKLPEVNHKDLNKSNNNVQNLEWCTRSENVNHFYNKTNTSSKHKGVYYQKDRKKWGAYVDYQGKRISLGRFNTESEAHKYRTNFINHEGIV